MRPPPDEPGHDPPWLPDVTRRARRWIDAGLGTAWVVAVSGGSDSVGLLRVLAELAPGLGLSPATGVISGTPSAAGAGQTFIFTVAVTDATGAQDNQLLQLTIS